MLRVEADTSRSKNVLIPQQAKNALVEMRLHIETLTLVVLERKNKRVVGLRFDVFYRKIHLPYLSGSILNGGSPFWHSSQFASNYSR